MDTLTHAFAGALLARASVRRAQAAPVPTWRRMTLGAVAAAFPDIDIVASYVSPLTYLLHHRGATHSVILLPAWAGLLAALAALLWRHPRSWKAYYGVAALGLASHILGDLITSYGTMVFAPLSDTRFAWHTTFIIDLWFSGIILAGLAASAIWRQSRVPALAATIALVGYVGLQAMLRNQAIDFGERYARAAGLGTAIVSAQPAAVSPFNWAVYVRTGEDYRYTYINLARRQPRPDPGPEAGFLEALSAPFHPPSAALWRSASLLGRDREDRPLAREAWAQPAFGFFRWFAEFPALYRIDRAHPSVCVWFYDLRFSRPGTDRLPFRYGLCRDGGGPWQRFQPIGDSGKAPFN